MSAPRKPPTTQIGHSPQVASPIRFDAYGITDIGCKRDLNEDNYIIHPTVPLWAVSDGMGGHERGDLASASVVEVLQRVRPMDDPRGLASDIVRQLGSANAYLRKEAERAEASAIGATAVCLLIVRGQALVVWAGDSRAYLLRQGQIRRISRDHSIVEEMVAEGLLDPSEAETHPHAHVLTRAVGVGDTLDLDFQQIAVRNDDLYLLCSDGLTRCFSDQELNELAFTYRDPKMICQRLIQGALERGAQDNVTVIAIRVVDGPV